MFINASQANMAASAHCPFLSGNTGVAQRF
jgi:hypothetical protein